MKSKSKSSALKKVNQTKGQAEKALSIFARPWFVIALVVTCFAILTPKIFLPLLRQFFGFGASSTSSTLFEESTGENFLPPNLRNRPVASPSGSAKMPYHDTSSSNSGPGDFPRSSGPQFGRKSYTPSTTTQGSSKSSVLSYLLPVYAIGIGVYMIYTLCKVFNKSDNNEKKPDQNEMSPESDFDDDDTNVVRKSKHVKFRERDLTTTISIGNNSMNHQKNLKLFSNQFQQRSEESEDEENDYERYKGLDPDYVSYLREARALKRDEARKKSALNSRKLVKLNQIEEIPLTSNTGLTSITNTNVLMNDTLERMKYSLNKINMQLSAVEKKGVGTSSSLDDPELESLRLQLTQTEMQMAKIMSIVNTVSNNIQTENKKFKKKKSYQQENDYDQLDDGEEDEVNLSDQVEDDDELEEEEEDEEEDEDSEMMYQYETRQRHMPKQNRLGNESNDDDEIVEEVSSRNSSPLQSHNLLANNSESSQNPTENNTNANGKTKSSRRARNRKKKNSNNPTNTDNNSNKATLSQSSVKKQAKKNKFHKPKEL